MLYNESKDNKSKEYRDRKANTRICYRGSAKCLRPRSKFDDLEIPLYGLLFYKWKPTSPLQRIVVTLWSQPLPYTNGLFLFGCQPHHLQLGLFF